MMLSTIRSVKGERGYWHATSGCWGEPNTLSILCRASRGINPYHLSKDTKEVDCPKCLEILRLPALPPSEDETTSSGYILK